MEPSKPSNNEATDHAGVIIKPPLLFVLAILLGFALQSFYPTPLLLSFPFNMGFGGSLILLALVLAIWAVKGFKHHKTPVPPWKPVTAIVTEGPYQFTRNPMYLGLCLMQLGIGLFFDNGWILALLVPVLIIFNLGIISREEKYLEKKFGETYLNYKATVRRWL